MKCLLQSLKADQSIKYIGELPGEHKPAIPIHDSCQIHKPLPERNIRDVGLPVHTIKFDNGKEFTAHEEIAEALNGKIYFVHPYASWERENNENTNALKRQYIPKGSSFMKLTKVDISFIEN